VEKRESLKYTCTKCGSYPSSSDSLMQGCSCGNKLFRVQNRGKKSKIIRDQVEKIDQIEKIAGVEKDIAQVEIVDNGIFVLDLDGLFKTDRDEPVIISAGGVYKLLNPSKM